MRNEAISQARTELLAESAGSVDERFAQMEKEEEIDRILNELKAKRGA
jgi:phage shock protein A